MHATDSETLLADPDFRAAIAGDGGQTVVQALENADERGLFFQTLGTDQYSGKSYLDGGELPVGLSEEVLKVGNVARKQLKSMKKADVPRHFLSVSLVSDVIKAKMNALSNHGEGCGRDACYDWRLFFSLENNQYLWAEKVIPVLGNLSAIYRQRRRFADCEKVMSVYKEILDRFEEMIARRRAARLSDDNELVNCRGLIYKYHRVAVNLGADLLRPDNLVPSYRILFQYEIDTKIVNTEEEEFFWIFSMCLGKPKTAAALAATTDAEMELMVKRLFVHFRQLHGTPEYQRENTYPAVQLAQCAGCGAKEPFLNTFKVCARCRGVKYCGKVQSR
eukprot:gene20169-22920_t